MKTQTKIKTPISYYGGKQQLLKHILPLIPPHTIYIEPFFGGGALYFAKDPSPVEIINDINMNVINFYQVLKTNFSALQQKIATTLLSRATYKKALLIYETPELFADSPIIRAWAFFIATNMWYSCKIGSWGYDKENKSTISFKNKVTNFKEALSQRLAQTQIENNPAHKVIERRDYKEAFIFCDPPYLGTNQGHYGGYVEEHLIRDLEVLAKIQWKFLLCHYPNEILDHYIKKHHWYTKIIDMPLTAGNRLKAAQGRRKKEILVANYKI